MSESIAFSGPRDGMTTLQRDALIGVLKDRPRGTFRHGDCVGSDKTAHAIASYLGWRVEIHPGKVPEFLRAFCTGAAVVHPPKPPLERNDTMVSLSSELVATPSGPEVLRSGTWSAIRRARRRGVARTLIWPDGSITQDETAQPQRGVG